MSKTLGIVSMLVLALLSVCTKVEPPVAFPPEERGGKAAVQLCFPAVIDSIAFDLACIVCELRGSVGTFSSRETRGGKETKPRTWG